MDAPAIVKAARSAFLGGSVSGALAAVAEDQHTPTSGNSTQSLGAQKKHEQINLEDEVNLDARLGIKYALNTTWDFAVNNLSKLMKAIDRIPVDSTSVKIMRSRGIQL